MAQASFFYYNPESGSDNRHHDLFSPQPSAILKSSPMPSQESMLQHLYMPSIARPLAQKSSLLSQEPHVLSLETEFAGLDDLSYPRTPDLSSTSSAMSSPPHSSYLPTPTTSFFENLTGVKEGCEHEVKSELLASFDFSRAGSPPLTPVFVNPPNVTASQASELLSTSSCPSLSPSPSPAPQQQFAVQQPESFCDPRNLLMSSKSALINQLDIPTLPAFIPSNDDLLLGCNPNKAVESTSVLEPLPPVVDSVPFFDSFSDLDSETDFITDLSQENGLQTGNKRPRVDSIPLSESLSQSSFEEEWAMSPLSETSEPSPKKLRIDDSNVEFDFASSFAGNSTETTTTVVSGASATDNQDAAITPAGDDGATGSGPANRRGRKQSLTDDPSKTFVCTLCSRRFRRQEHLKRHYRSLHTQDKPFECTDCGKKFSRSDNLAQHARTHGNTTIVGVNMSEMDEKTASMSALLFETAADVSSASSNSSEDEKAAAKKRKRDE